MGEVADHCCGRSGGDGGYGCGSGLDEFMNDLNRPYTDAELSAREARRAGQAKQFAWYTPDEAIV